MLHTLSCLQAERERNKTLTSMSLSAMTSDDIVHTCLQDVVYFFQPEEDCLVTVATCNSAQFKDNFDTILYVLGNATGPGVMETVACNDDACSYFSQLQVILHYFPCQRSLTCKGLKGLEHEHAAIQGVAQASCQASQTK